MEKNRVISKWKHDLKIKLITSANYLLKYCAKVNIKSTEETIDKIVNERYSLARFGDGELEIIYDGRITYQQRDEKLKRRLIEIIQSMEKDILIALPKPIIDTEILTEEARCFWNEHASLNRHRWYKVINRSKTYYDTQITRLYMDHKDKNKSKILFSKIKKLWEDRDIVIIEGEKSRLGMGNDLFINARSIQRILAPSTNAFSKYDEILEKATNVNKNKLILVALGPTATVLAFDLGKLGYQAIDIGHIDIEYEWLLKQADKKIKIDSKFTNESINGSKVDDTITDDYESQIIDKVI